MGDPGIYSGYLVKIMDGERVIRSGYIVGSVTMYRESNLYFVLLDSDTPSDNPCVVRGTN